jgi:hypothetical protein
MSTCSAGGDRLPGNLTWALAGEAVATVINS